MAFAAPSPAALDRPQLRIDLAAIARNWRLFRDAGPGAAAAVLKADAYGLGAGRVGPALLAAGCGTFFVANTAEGAELRAALGAADAEVFVLNGCPPGDEAMVRAHRLAPVLNTLAQIERWAGAAGGAPSAVHVDTGMNRLGLTGPEWSGVRERSALLQAAGVSVVMSHLACADAPDHPMNGRQRARFEAVLADARRSLPGVRGSLANSAGALVGPAFRSDLVRPGIGLFGGAPFAHPAPACAPALAPVVTLRAPILQTREVAAGERVGYGGDFTADRSRILATVALGYADGVLRAAGGRGYGVLGGARTPIVGRISMDLITVDVTAARAAATPGALVEFIGPNVSLDELAGAGGSLAYELLTRLGPRCARTYVDDEGAEA